MMPSIGIGKPFVKWVGGKSQLIPTIEKSLPEGLSALDGFTYVEPFVGGGAMLFFMLQRFKGISRAVVNDLNPHLITTYRIIKTKPEPLVAELAKLQTEYLSMPEYEQQKQMYLQVRTRFNKGDLSDLDRASLFIFLNKTCFNGLYRENSKGEFNVPVGRYKSPAICDPATIYADSRLLQNVEILCGDFAQVEAHAGSDTFVYFDPPYRPLNATSNFNSYVKEAFNDGEQTRLRNFYAHLDGKGCMLMLSNSDGAQCGNTFLDDLYNGYYINRVAANRFVNANPEGRGKITELLITNYPVTTTQQYSLDLKFDLHEPSAYRRTV